MQIEKRPWGHFETALSGDGYSVKRIVVNPGAAISLQYHNRRAERWTIVEGAAHATIGFSERLMHPGAAAYVPAGTVHRLENRGDRPLVVIEVQIGDHLSEDDIVRLEDRYGRA